MKHRGHEISYNPDNDCYEYTGTKQPVKDNINIACGYCGKENAPEGYDGCIGELNKELVMNACCGHGTENDAYLQLNNGLCIRGKDALQVFKNVKLKRNNKMKLSEHIKWAVMNCEETEPKKIQSHLLDEHGVEVTLEEINQILKTVAVYNKD